MDQITGGEVERRWWGQDILGRIASSLGRVIPRRDSGVRRALEQILVELDLSYNAIEEVARKLQRRYNELYTQALRAVTEKSLARATIYANEMVEIRKIFKRLRIALTFIEQLKLRVGTLSELDKIRPSLAEFQRMLDLLKPQLAPIVPNVVTSLDRVMTEISFLTGSTSTPEPATGQDVRPDSREASELLKKIMSDAQRSVDESLPQMLPELARLVTVDVDEEIVSLPPDFYAVRTNEKSLPQHVQQREAPRQAPQPQKVQRPRPGLEDIDRMLLDYVISRGGFLDMEDFSKICSCTREEIVASLDRLVRSKRISIVR